MPLVYTHGYNNICLSSRNNNCVLDGVIVFCLMSCPGLPFLGIAPKGINTPDEYHTYYMADHVWHSRTIFGGQIYCSVRQCLQPKVVAITMANLCTSHAAVVCCDAVMCDCYLLNEFLIPRTISLTSNLQSLKV